MKEPKEPRVRPLTHRTTRIFVVVLVLIVILLSALLAYLYVETAAEGQEVPEGARSEETLETGTVGEAGDLKVAHLLTL